MPGQDRPINQTLAQSATASTSALAAQREMHAAIALQDWDAAEAYRGRAVALYEAALDGYMVAARWVGSR